ncbi:MAG TPA: hypothetical protein VL282_17475 [Tepidisphaeraceae bacterium]|jgi:hypothetical protein|nr:hypothetical protein [Tepidisphaeraceae bacterium]
MRRQPSLEHVEEAFRIHVCGNCPCRTPGTDRLQCNRGRPCEEGCELFELLPNLYETARHLDPMIGRRHHALNEMLVSATSAAKHGALKVRDQAAKTLHTVEHLFYPD